MSDGVNIKIKGNYYKLYFVAYALACDYYYYLKNTHAKAYVTYFRNVKNIINFGVIISIHLSTFPCISTKI
jgi:hypothetical protein